MRLVFVHGWAFDARFWDALAAELHDIPQTRIDQGFFGTPTCPPLTKTDILVGHSLGFLHGLNIFSYWAGWIAINSFPRFVATPDKAGCVDAATLEGTRASLLRDTPKCLQRFHAKLGGKAPNGTPDQQFLLRGLDALRDNDAALAPSLLKPALVLAARDDFLVPAATSQDLTTTAHATLGWSDDGGHLLPITRPVWCAEKIRTFLKVMNA